MIEMDYQFNNPGLLEAALTHSSYANERGNGIRSNERLEFLGDSILGYLVAEHLYGSRADMPEGKMTRLRAELVCEQSLVRAARELGLGELLKLGKGEEMTGGRERPSILADAVEALLAAIYLDGGIVPAKAFVRKYILAQVDDSASGDAVADYKTALQELVQRGGLRTLSYEAISASGPEHDKRFVSQALVDGKPMGQGEGRSKKESEQAAAREALERVR